MYCRNFIGGRWLDGPGIVERVNPADRRIVVSRVAQAADTEACLALEAALASRDVWRRTPAERRDALLAAVVAEVGRRGYRDSELPLAGWPESGHGIPQCGRFARDFYTRTKAVYRPAAGEQP